ncbi:MAG: alpha/beta hydrolase [Deltaproteobacteria bacterium]|nr:alpha/beta hydrolase [Deltaproteobacteria bacterium]
MGGYLRAAGGRGRRFLLLHGNPGNLDSFRVLAPALRTLGDVAFIDTPGFGKSPGLPGGGQAIGLRPLADLFLAFVDRLGRERVIVVGHSHGGAIAQTMAARYPERIAGLVLLASLGYPAHWSYRLLSLPGAETALGLAARAFPRRSLRPVLGCLVSQLMRPVFSPERVSKARLDEELHRLVERPEILVHMAQLAQGRPSERLREQIAEIHAPCLFIHGAFDRLVAARYTRNLHLARLRSQQPSRFVRLPTAGHMLPLFQAAEVAVQIGEWLPEVERQG